MAELKKGDRVEWSFRGHRVVGVVQRKLTRRTEIDGRTVAATAEEPRYLLKTERTGKRVTHRAAVLKKLA
jgi:hypothetical protein